MGFRLKIPEFTEHFSGKDAFSTDEIHRYFAQGNKDIGRSTVYWRIYELIAQGKLIRIGRGKFMLSGKPVYQCSVTRKQSEIFRRIKAKLPLVHICCWQISILNEFFHHIPNQHSLIVETEKESVTSVFSMLKEFHRDTFINPDSKMMEEVVSDSKTAIIVKNLISQAPIQLQSRLVVPTLEKILVDLVADTEIFYFAQGHELKLIYENIFAKYAINIDKILRYAKRRNMARRVVALINSANSMEKPSMRQKSI